MRKELITVGLAGSLAFTTAACANSADKNDSSSNPSATQATCLENNAGSADKLPHDSDFMMTNCSFIGRASFGNAKRDNADFVQVTFENRSNHIPLVCMATVNYAPDAGTNITCDWEAYNVQVSASTTSTTPLK